MARDLVYTVRTMIYFYAKANIVFVCARVCVVSKGIVEGHKGEVSVHSEGEGMGCTFTLKLPSRIPATYSSIILGKSSVGKSLSLVTLVDEVRQRDICTSGESIVDISTPPVRYSTCSTLSNGYILDYHQEYFHESIRGLESKGERKGTEVQKRTSHIPSVPCRSTSLGPGLPRMLVVDDVESNRKMMCRLLRERCGEFKHASNGLEALRLVTDSLSDDGTPFDIISMDYQMPVMDGPEAARKIRDMGYTGLMLGVTGNALGEDIRYFKEHGVDDVLTKPINISHFDSILAKYRS